MALCQAESLCLSLKLLTSFSTSLAILGIKQLIEIRTFHYIFFVHNMNLYHRKVKQYTNIFQAFGDYFTLFVYRAMG